MLWINIVEELKYLLKLGLANPDQQNRGHIALEVQKLKTQGVVAVIKCNGDDGDVNKNR